MVNFAVVAHKPGVGVKVYSVVVVLSKGGFHVPVIALVDVNGNGVNAFPEQIGVTALKVGIILGFTVTVLVASVSEQPPVPVKIYLIVAVPLAFPVISPVVAFTDAIVGLEDSHLPPKTVELKVVELPTQIACVPLNVPALCGAETVTFLVAGTLAGQPPVPFTM